VDSDRPSFFQAPRAALEGGDFDLTVRSRTEGHYVGLRTASVAAVSSTESFAFNLLKSVLILWMLSVLVVIISVFCSTFVSWPIAVVLTLVILLGRWCVTQLGDPASPQQMATDLGFVNPVGARVFTDTLGALNKMLTITSKVLPDVDVSQPISLKVVTKKATHELERQIILKVLKAHNWNRQKTAKWLKISYRSLLYKLNEVGADGMPLPGAIARNKTQQRSGLRTGNEQTNLIQ